MVGGSFLSPSHHSQSQVWLDDPGIRVTQHGMPHSHAPETANDGDFDTAAATAEVSAPTRPGRVPAAPQASTEQQLTSGVADAALHVPDVCKINRRRTSPLPGIEPADTENTDENPSVPVSATDPHEPFPLPGTIVPSRQRRRGPKK